MSVFLPQVLTILFPCLLREVFAHRGICQEIRSGFLVHFGKKLSPLAVDVRYSAKVNAQLLRREGRCQGLPSSITLIHPRPCHSPLESYGCAPPFIAYC